MVDEKKKFETLSFESVRRVTDDDNTASYGEIPMFLGMLASLDKDMSQMGNADNMKDVPDVPVNKTTSKTEVNIHAKSYGSLRLVSICRKRQSHCLS